MVTANSHRNQSDALQGDRDVCGRLKMGISYKEASFSLDKPSHTTVCMV